jgi:hypothetical protein
VRYSETVFAIFEAFPDIAGRQADLDRLGGDISRELERMNTCSSSQPRLSRTPLNFGGGPRDRQAAITLSS